jgi:holo-[acyl-carrier protein] synthase
MVAGHGIDIVEIGRVRGALKRFGKKFLARLFDPREIAEGNKFKDPSAYYASRFAAKEAFAKAVGTGFRGFGPIDVAVLRADGQPPHFGFSPKLSARFPGMDAADFLLSISHERGHAIASVIRRGARK